MQFTTFVFFLKKVVISTKDNMEFTDIGQYK